MLNEYQQIEKAHALLTSWDDLKDSGKRHRKGQGKLFITGDCSIFDYNRGFVYVMIYMSKNLGKDNTYSVRVWYETIDDSCFGGWIDQIFEEKDALALFEKVHQSYKDLIKLPSDEEMNSLLLDTGMVVGLE